MKQKANQVQNQEDEKLQDLLREATSVLEGIEDDLNITTNRLNLIEDAVKKSIEKLKKEFSELDRLEKETGDALDALVVRQARFLSGE